MNIRSGCLMLLIALVVTTCTPRAPMPQPVTETPTITLTPTLPLPTPTMKVWTYDEMTVGFIQAGSGDESSGDEWYTVNSASFSDLAREQGLTLKFYDAQFRPEAQITAFRDFIQDPDVNVIVLNAIVPTGWDELLKLAQAAGKVVVLEDRPIEAPNDLYATYVGSDFVEQGRKAAIEMCKLLDSGNKIVLELTGSTTGPDAYKAIERSQGFHEKTGECGITIIQAPTANLDGAGGEVVMEAFLRKNADIQGVFAQNEGLTLNANQAIKRVGLKPGVDIKVVSIFATPVLFNANPGIGINACIESNPLLAPQVYEAARRALNSEMLPKWIPVQETIFYPKGGKWIWDHSQY